MAWCCAVWCGAASLGILFRLGLRAGNAGAPEKSVSGGLTAAAAQDAVCSWYSLYSYCIIHGSHTSVPLGYHTVQHTYQQAQSEEVRPGFSQTMQCVSKK